MHKMVLVIGNVAKQMNALQVDYEYDLWTLPCVVMVARCRLPLGPSPAA
jgi:hypothetical protein